MALLRGRKRLPEEKLQVAGLEDGGWVDLCACSVAGRAVRDTYRIAISGVVWTVEICHNSRSQCDKLQELGSGPAPLTWQEHVEREEDFE